MFADRLEAAAERFLPFLPFLQSSDQSISASLLEFCRALRLSSDAAIITQSRRFHCTVSMHVQTGPTPRSLVPKFPTPATHSPSLSMFLDYIGVRSVLVPHIAARGERWRIHLEMSLSHLQEEVTPWLPSGCLSLQPPSSRPSLPPWTSCFVSYANLAGRAVPPKGNFTHDEGGGRKG